MSLLKAQGRLMAIGGEEDKTGECRILKEFARLAGGEKAELALITAATESPEETAAEYKTVFRRLGVKQVKHLRIAERADAMKPESVEAIEKATGIFFTGGDQLHITSLMGSTDLQRMILERSKKDLLVGGTSAGAAMMGNSMIVSGESDENPRNGAVEMAPGTDLIVGCIVDTHFSQRGRHGRLLTAVAHFPQDLGFGIDENTAMIVGKNKFKVFGAGAVTVIDGSSMSHTDVPFVQKGESLTLGDVKIHVLGDGAEFDFSTRQIIVPRRAKYKTQTAANENNTSKKTIERSGKQQ